MCNIKTASERLQSFIDGDEFSKLKRVEDLSLKHSRFVAEEIQELRSRIDGLEAARIAYANEFELNSDGEPDVGSIHQNIRKLKAENKDLVIKLHERTITSGAKIHELNAEVTHWKANHAGVVERLRIAANRPDLPSDRFPTFDKLKAENKKLRIIMMSASKKLNSSEDCSNVAQQLCDAALQQDVPDIDVLPEN